MGEFITVSLHPKSRSVFQGERSWSDFQRSEKYRLSWEGRIVDSLGRDFRELGDCKVAVRADWEGFPFCFFTYGRREAEGIGIAGNVAAPDLSRPTPGK